MNKRITLILEYVWLILALLTAIGGTVRFYFSGFETSYVLFIISCIAALMYMLRKSIRKISEQK
jgi:hypothetical protein